MTSDEAGTSESKTVRSRSKLLIAGVLIVVALVFVGGVIFRNDLRPSAELESAAANAKAQLPPECTVSSEKFISRLNGLFNGVPNGEVFHKTEDGTPLKRIIASCSTPDRQVIDSFTSNLERAGYAKGFNVRSRNGENVIILYRAASSELVLGVYV